jgi:hypothetical protein
MLRSRDGVTRTSEELVSGPAHGDDEYAAAERLWVGAPNTCLQLT